MTAAHCTLYLSPSTSQIVAGAHTLSGNPSHMYHNTFKIVNHPDYEKEWWLDNDIALIQVEPPFTFTDDARPICPPEADNIYISEEAVVSGWGLTVDGKSLHRNPGIETGLAAVQFT